MEYKIIVAGIGPGNPDYMLPAAVKAIQQAAVLVGSRRALKDFARPDQAFERFAVSTENVPEPSITQGAYLLHDVVLADIGSAVPVGFA